MYTCLLYISIFTLCRYLPYPKLDCAAVVAAEPANLVQKLLARLAREKYFMKYKKHLLIDYLMCIRMPSPTHSILLAMVAVLHMMQ